ncbi:hypothetical protein GCM10010324_67740 [Streptomyces hiroshimensis]|uniref:Uncharacterized protein n=1 Tax=Streptomyces hiroshimensis TaxID=66424 RepID=A0ABQ2ZFT6_9ACTN|nr:hypothetical protein GCM10010324_67740 [Streptomyces hiroshimensis]
MPLEPLEFGLTAGRRLGGLEPNGLVDADFGWWGRGGSDGLGRARGCSAAGDETSQCCDKLCHEGSGEQPCPHDQS